MSARICFKPAVDPKLSCLRIHGLRHLGIFSPFSAVVVLGFISVHKFVIRFISVRQLARKRAGGRSPP